MRRLRLSYANVVATLALFVALGGSAFAATQIDGHQIKKYSIPASRLVKGAVVPRAKLANNVKVLILSKGNHRFRAPHKSARVANVSSGASSLAGLSFGQSAQALSVGPFTITAKCENGGSDGTWLELDATSSTDNWYATYSAPGPNVNTAGPWSAGEVIPIFRTNFSNSFSLGIAGLPLISSDGSVITVAGTASFNQVNDCAYSLYAIT